jgi:cation transport ATPase
MPDAPLALALRAAAGAICAGFCSFLRQRFVVWAGRGIYLSAARGLRHGTTNMNTLVSLGTGVAFFYSAYATIWPAPGRQVYFDAVLLILGFLLLGKALEGARQTPRPGRARLSLPTASPQPPAASATAETIVPLEEIQPGDSVLSCLENASRWMRRFLKAAPPWTNRC